MLGCKLLQNTSIPKTLSWWIRFENSSDAAMLSSSEVVAVAIGATGSAMMFIAYLLVNFQTEMGKWAVSETSLIYLWLNFIGGGLASFSAFLTGSTGAFPVGVLEALWGLVGLFGLLRHVVRSVNVAGTRKVEPETDSSARVEEAIPDTAERPK